jgi:hypothetical protein
MRCWLKPAALFSWGEKIAAAETLQFSAAITCQLWQVGRAYSKSITS